MNRVFVLKDKETQGGGIFYCKSGLAGMGISADDEVFIHENQEVRNYIESFLRKGGINKEAQNSLKFHLDRLID